MQNAAASDKASAQNAILKVLRATTADISLSELLNTLTEKGFNEADVKTAVWQLIDKQTVEMTSERKLRCIKSSSRAATA